MKREEAINLIGWLKSKTNRDDDLEAIDMAIEALSKPIVDITQRDLCEDISCTDCPFMQETCKLMDYVAYADRPHGEWVDKEVFNETDDDHIVDEWQSARCSVCGKYHTTPCMYYFDNFNFCPNCGADMRKENK